MFSTLIKVKTKQAGTTHKLSPGSSSASTCKQHAMFLLHIRSRIVLDSGRQLIACSLVTVFITNIGMLRCLLAFSKHLCQQICYLKSIGL